MAPPLALMTSPSLFFNCIFRVFFFFLFNLIGFYLPIRYSLMIPALSVLAVAVGGHNNALLLYMAKVTVEVVVYEKSSSIMFI